MSTVTEKSATETRFARWRNRLVLIPQVLLLWFWAKKYHVNEFRFFVHNYLAVHRSGLFLPKFYHKASKRSKGKFGFLSHVASIAHFLEIGMKEGLNPNPLFSVEFYLNTYPDVRASRMNPLVHYILFGGSEDRSTHLLFDGRYYQDRLVGQIDQADTPLRDFLRKGTTGTRNPCLLFDCAHYLEQKPDLKDCADNPLIHYLLVGARTGFDPHPYFSSTFYLEKYQHEIPKETSPLEFFLDAGGYRYHQPSPRFDCSYYLEVNPDIKKAGLIPLVHYLEFGHLERRLPKDFYKERILHQESQAPTDTECTNEIARFQYQPKFSVIVPVFNTDEIWLKAAINSVIDQVYPHWELCIADDGSTKPHVRPVLDEYQVRDSRIKVTYRPESGHISAASNTALSMASGDFIALLDHDDLLDRFALFENARLLNVHPRAEIIYSDEDKINQNGLRYEPFFKPDWSPELLLSQMYCGHLGVYKRDLIERIRGFREGYEGSQDYDLILRASELTDEIYHIPKVLYHWRTIDGSTAADPTAKNYAYLSGEKALQDAANRRGIDAKSFQIPKKYGQYALKYSVETRPKVSIIVPSIESSDQLKKLAVFLGSFALAIDYPEFEILVVLSRSVILATPDMDSNLEAEIINNTPSFLVEHVRSCFKSTVRFVVSEEPSNYPRLINVGARHASGELLFCLSDSTDSIEALYDSSKYWLHQMASRAQLEPLGSVGGLIVDRKRDVVISSGMMINSDGTPADMHQGESAASTGYFGRLLVSSNCSAVCLDCLLTRRSLFENKGGLDEGLSADLAALDYGLWLRDNGYRNVMLPQFRFSQADSESSGVSENATDDMERNEGWAHFSEKWSALLPKTDPYYNPNLMIKGRAARFDLDLSFRDKKLTS